MRKFTVPTTFSSEFIDSLVALNTEFSVQKSMVYEVYGSFQSGAFHSARPSKYLPAVSRSQFSAHVRKAGDNGIRFNYLLNAPAYANLEYTHEGRKKLEELLSYLADAGVSTITVAVPYLQEIIRNRFPAFEIVTSTVGYVNSFAGLAQFTDAGATRIVLDVEVNRDFLFLEKCVESRLAELEVIVNPVCISQCHFKYNHYCVASTGAQSFLYNGAGAPYNQYYLNWCFLRKLQHPAEFLKSPWLRPEDLHLWYDRGIRYFKIAGRGLDSTRILQLCRSYLGCSFTGNLLELLGWPHWLCFRDTPDGKRLPPLDIMLENDLLQGFLAYFAEHKPQCRYGCATCGYCQRWAEKVLAFNDADLLESYRQNMERNLRGLVETIPSGLQSRAAAEQWRKQAAARRIKN